ncbi:MAG: NAD(P)-dependent oxidoreductase [Caldilineaceae bacterium]
MIGCGILWGGCCCKLLRPSTSRCGCTTPICRELAEALGFTQTSLDNVLSQCDVVVCLVPLTPVTTGMIGQRELDLIPASGLCQCRDCGGRFGSIDCTAQAGVT